MSFEYRSVTAEEFPTFARTDAAAFGVHHNEDELAAESAALEFDRTLAAFEGGRIVGTTAVLSLDLTLPGGASIPASGLTWTGVLPTHRRRGLLTEMIRRQQRSSVDRGEPLSILLASESTIYGRFGYGIATNELGFSVSTAHSGFRADSADLGEAGRCELLEPENEARVLPDIFDRLRNSFPGAVGRTEGLWHAYLADPEHHREGASGMFHTVHRAADGTPDGYVSYRIKSDWDEGVPQGTLTVQELLAPTPAAHAALWRYCLDMDLIATVRTAHAPVDETLRWVLRDPRHLRVDRLNDGLWVRILDVPAVLAARAYGSGRPHSDDALVFEVADSFHPDTAGRYLLEAGAGGAACVRTTRAADVALDISDLGAIYLGAVDFSTLVRARRVHESTDGAATRADALFRTDRAPWCSTHF